MTGDQTAQPKLSIGYPLPHEYARCRFGLLGVLLVVLGSGSGAWIYRVRGEVVVVVVVVVERFEGVSGYAFGWARIGRREWVGGGRVTGQSVRG